MFELIQLLEKSSPTIYSDFSNWFKKVPAAAAWNVFSDYNLGDRNKQNDVFSFVISPNHDTFKNIASYIAAVAPSDIKDSRTTSEGLLDYLACPVTFSFSLRCP